MNPLAITPELNASAKAHANDMVAHGYMEHEGLDGSTPQSRARAAGYLAPPSSAWLVLEVISARQTAEAAANWLLSDALHRGVLLRGYWREMGAAYVQGGPYGQFWVVEFGCRPNVLPVEADPNPSGGVTLHLSNEDCTPTGTADAIGRATQVMVSDNSNFDGATWEPFVTTKVLNGSTGNVFVKYRDARGHETVASTQDGGGNPVVITAASAATTTLNSATPPPPGADDGSPSDQTPGLFSPKPGFVFQPSGSGH